MLIACQPLLSAARFGRSGGSSRRGVALVMVLFLIVLLILAGAMSVAMLVKRQQDFQRERRAIHLQGLLDSGVSVALSIYSQQRSFEGSETRQLDGGSFELTARVDTSTRRSVEVHAFYQGDERLATATLYVPPTGRPSLVDWTYQPPPRIRPER